MDLTKQYKRSGSGQIQDDALTEGIHVDPDSFWSIVYRTVGLLRTDAVQQRCVSKHR